MGNTYELYGVGVDAKTIHGEDVGVLTAIIYMAPSDLSGRLNVCAYASDGCRGACLYWAGHGILATVQAARTRKTLFFADDLTGYMAALVRDSFKLRRAAKRRAMIAAARLNGTSDLPYERIPVVIDGVRYPNIMTAFPDITFYDYTKAPYHKRPAHKLPSNYSLTMSRSETNEADCLEALAHGRNVAIPFAVKRGQALPATWHGYEVIDGDRADVRFADPIGVVVGLRAKGQGIGDTSGFVVTVSTTVADVRPNSTAAFMTWEETSTIRAAS
jgi:hypothetical protein